MGRNDLIPREAALNILCKACGNLACRAGGEPRCSYYGKMQRIQPIKAIENEQLLQAIRYAVESAGITQTIRPWIALPERFFRWGAVRTKFWNNSDPLGIIWAICVYLFGDPKANQGTIYDTTGFRYFVRRITEPYKEREAEDGSDD